MPFDKQKNQRKAFCFITFDSEQIVNELLKTPKQTISGKEVDVKKATPKPDNAPVMQRGGGGRNVRGGRGGRGGNCCIAVESNIRLSLKILIPKQVNTVRVGATKAARATDPMVRATARTTPMEALAAANTTTTVADMGAMAATITQDTEIMVNTTTITIHKKIIIKINNIKNFV